MTDVAHRYNVERHRHTAYYYYWHRVCSAGYHVVTSVVTSAVVAELGVRTAERRGILSVSCSETVATSFSGRVGATERERERERARNTTREGEGREASEVEMWEAQVERYW